MTEPIKEQLKKILHSHDIGFIGEEDHDDFSILIGEELIEELAKLVEEEKLESLLNQLPTSINVGEGFKRSLVIEKSEILKEWYVGYIHNGSWICEHNKSLKAACIDMLERLKGASDYGILIKEKGEQ